MTDEPRRPDAHTGRQELVVVVLVAVVLALVVGVVLTRKTPDAAPALAQPATAPVPVAPAARAAWAAATSARTGVPLRVLRAYGDAEVSARDSASECGISWATLAGIGRVESDHGRFGDAEVGVDGRPDPPVVGVALDGTRGNREVRDTDDGRLDGDTVHDRAVGPLQFIPTTWGAVGTDADGDGRADPQDVDDAAAAAAVYLCRGTTGDADRDVRRGDGWRAAVLSYNRSTPYVERVHREAVGYATTAAP